MSLSNIQIAAHNVVGGYNSTIFGKQYFVDGTYGSTSAPGTFDEPLSLIQAAVTRQIAESQGRGDVIYVAPGTYAETIYASELTNVWLQGTGFSPEAVIVAPTDDHALLVGVDAAGGTAAGSTMTNSAISNMTFLTPSTSSVVRAAVLVGVMTKSVIEDVHFKGTTVTGTGALATIGLQIGHRTDAEWEFHEHSRISRCLFTSNAGRTTQPGIGIEVGSHTKASPTYSGFKSMIIEDCIISAKDRGIRLNVGGSSCGGSVIRRNEMIAQETGGVGVGIEHVPADDTLCMIHENRIVYIQDAIAGFTTGNVQGNIVAKYNVEPTDESGYNN